MTDQSEFPALALVSALYQRRHPKRGNGQVAFAHRDKATGEMVYPVLELVRLTLPRRVYTQRHLDHAIETVVALKERRDELEGYRIVYKAPYLRHFTARFEPL